MRSTTDGERRPRIVRRKLSCCCCFSRWPSTWKSGFSKPRTRTQKWPAL